MSKVDKEKGNIPNAKKYWKGEKTKTGTRVTLKKIHVFQYRRNASNINFDIKNLKSLEIRILNLLRMRYYNLKMQHF